MSTNQDSAAQKLNLQKFIVRYHGRKHEQAKEFIGIHLQYWVKILEEKTGYYYGHCADGSLAMLLFCHDLGEAFDYVKKDPYIVSGCYDRTEVVLQDEYPLIKDTEDSCFVFVKEMTSPVLIAHSISIRSENMGEDSPYPIPIGIYVNERDRAVECTEYLSKVYGIPVLTDTQKLDGLTLHDDDEVGQTDANAVLLMASLAARSFEQVMERLFRK